MLPSFEPTYVNNSQITKKKKLHHNNKSNQNITQQLKIALHHRLDLYQSLYKVNLHNESILACILNNYKPILEVLHTNEDRTLHDIHLLENQLILSSFIKLLWRITKKASNLFITDLNPSCHPNAAHLQPSPSSSQHSINYKLLPNNSLTCQSKLHDQVDFIMNIISITNTITTYYPNSNNNADNYSNNNKNNNNTNEINNHKKTNNDNDVIWTRKHLKLLLHIFNLMTPVITQLNGGGCINNNSNNNNYNNHNNTKNNDGTHDNNNNETNEHNTKNDFSTNSNHRCTNKKILKAIEKFIVGQLCYVVRWSDGVFDGSDNIGDNFPSNHKDEGGKDKEHINDDGFKSTGDTLNHIFNSNNDDGNNNSKRENDSVAVWQKVLRPVGFDNFIGNGNKDIGNLFY